MTSYQGNIITKNPETPTGPTATGRAPGMWKLNEVTYWIKQGVWPNANIVPDQYFPYVSLLLSTTALGNANNNLFADSSGAFNPISRNGNTTQGSATPYGANWSNYFDGSGDYLSVPTSTSLAFGTGDFTIEFWIYVTANSGDWFPISSIGNGGFFFGQRAGSGWGYGSTGNFWSYNTGTNPVLNTWQHIAISRSGTSLRIFADGTQIGTTRTDSSDWSLATGGTSIGSQGAAYYTTGYISNMRVLKGVGLYTSNFTPSTTPLTAITNTSLLTCQSNRFRDASTNNFTITATGNTSVTEFSPFAPAYPGISYNQSDITNWSGYFDGSGDYLQMPSNAAFAFGTGDYTIEGWIYTTVSGTDKRITWFSDDRHNIDINTSNQIFLYDGSIRTFGTIVLGAWNHFAVSRTSGTVSCYLNGVRGYNASETTNSTTRSMNIASNNAGNAPFNGSISNIRVVKGTGVYSGATITVPTTNLTAISGTSLLTCQNAAFTDNSTNNFVITINGNTTVTGNSPFNTVGYWSNYFDGSGDYLSSSATTIANFGTGDFTVECWVYSLATGQLNILDFRGTGGTGNAFRLGQVAATGKFAAGWGSNDTVLSSTTNIILNQWTHIAVTRSGSTARMFINGALEATATSSTDIPDSGLIVASYTGSTAFFNGYISNARVVKGTAVYTAAFTPPTTPLTAITNTSLLTCQASRFIDSSSNAFAITVNGNTSIQSFDPFYTSTIASNGGSMYFDGTGDYLAVPNAANLQFGTSNFTVECWFNSNVATTDVHNTIIGKWGSGFSTSGDWAIRSRFSTGNQAAVTLRYSSGWYDMTTGINIIDGAWHHLAFVRENSTTLKFYIDGVVRATRTISASDIVGSSATLSIGGPAASASGEAAMTGYVSNARITNGSALYTATFTPTTSVLTPSGNTVLLVNGMNAGAYDATAINNMETVGNAQVSTAVSKFGGSSMYFDGTGDYLLTPSNPAYGLASSNFTIEAWVYVTSSSEPYQAVVKAVGSGSNNLMFIDYSGGSTGVLSSQSGGTAATRSGVTLNTWHHLAVVRNGTSVTCYVNGVGGTSQTIDPGSSGSVSLLVGYDGGTSPARYFNGYIDDLRITKGVARYTANFTPPTQAFPTY